MEWMIHNGFCHGLISGNAVGVHDIEAALYGTTLGMLADGSGSAGGVTLSKDPEQRWIYVPDSTNNVVWILARASLEVVGHVGRLGTMAGQC